MAALRAKRNMAGTDGAFVKKGRLPNEKPWEITDLVGLDFRELDETSRNTGWEGHGLEAAVRSPLGWPRGRPR